jgi:hypothetical protein
MASVLYYSNYCEHSKKLLQTLSKTQVSKDIHFICIDKRVKEANGKIYIVMENGQQIVMPENVEKVPALLLLSENYKVLYGDNIYTHLKPRQEAVTKVATQNNMEPMAFGFSGNLGGIASDHFSFLDMDSDSLNTKGNGGMRQMHSYVALNENGNIPTPTDDFDYKQSKLGDGITIEQLQQQRDQDLSQLTQGQRRI